MNKVKDVLDYRNMYLSRRISYLFSIFAGFITLLFMSNTVFALAPNPGAICNTNFSKGSLTNADYSSLASAVNTNNYVTVAGNSAGSIPLQIKINTVESSSSTTLSNFGVITAGNNNAINIRRTFPNTTAFTDINLDFRNSITSQPIFLTNVALSAFDIDYANGNGNAFDDYIKITGTNEQGNTVSGTFQQITGSNITGFEQGLRTSTTNTANCPAKDLGTQCQGSVQFPTPVSSVKIRYTNTGRLAQNPTNQEIDFRVDNYCYIPQYVFSGTVFDDNGGITANEASATNADITSSASPYTNRPNYFNGIFNTPQESGINGSTVNLVNCANTSTVYNAQSVIRDNASIGEYQISIPTTTLGNNTNLCLLESRTATTYPIRTNNQSKNAGFSATVYNYPDNNFGRVIAANAALVLEKEQAPNKCDITSLTDTSLNYSKAPLSTSGNNPDIRPGQCIAYKITATNRANISIDNFTMQDILQKQGVNSATVTSVLTNPARATGVFSDTLINGQNGTVTTMSQTLPNRQTRSFYFNTKYGSTVNPQ